MRNWLVVANAARARVLEDGAQPGTYAHVADLVHPGSRQKGSELATDRPGHVEGTGHGLGSASYQPRTDPRQHEHVRFAREVAALLDAGIAEGRCAGLVLCASNPFLGVLKAQLSDRARGLLLRSVPSDYTGLRDDQLAERLAPPPP